MQIKLITATNNPYSRDGREDIYVVNLPGVQVCHFEDYRSELERIAKMYDCRKIEIFERQYKFAGTIDSGKIKISLN